MIVIEWLERIKELDKLIDSKIAECNRLRDLATDTTSKMPDGMPYSNTGMVSRKIENAAVEIMTLEKEIDELVDEFVDHKQAVVDALKKLPRKEYDVLHSRYICYLTWEKIAENLNYSVQHVRRIRNKALETLTWIVSG